MGCDCPIFAGTKHIQWTFPDEDGKGNCFEMFGGIHLEKGLWNALGDILEGTL